MTTRKLVYWKPQYLEPGTKEYDFLHAFFHLCESECRKITMSGRESGAAGRAAGSCRKVLLYADRLIASVMKYQPETDLKIFEKQLLQLLSMSTNSGVTKAAKRIKTKEKQLDLYIELKKKERKINE